MNIGAMTIREFAKKHDIEVVGKLTRVRDVEATPQWRSYEDENKTVFSVHVRTKDIVITGEDEDGCVWVL